MDRTLTYEFIEDNSNKEFLYRMITFKNLNSATPYKKFLSFYKEAIEKNQPNIEAVSISSFDKKINEVQSRFVNLKYIIDDEWIFSNYQSPKAKSFESHNQITALFIGILLIFKQESRQTFINLLK